MENYDLYHIFVAYSTASEGGKHEVNLRDGKHYQVTIPCGSSEGIGLRLPKIGWQNRDIVLIIHTFFDKEKLIKSSIEQLIDSLDLRQESKERCKAAYELISEAEAVNDLAALELLDFIVAKWLKDKGLRERYIIASQNSRLVSIERAIDAVVSISTLDKSWIQILKGTYQTLRAYESVGDFQALNHLDFIVQSTSLSEELKQFYLHTSIATRATAVDRLITNFIDESFSDEAEKNRYLSAYNSIRDNKKERYEIESSILDDMISTSLLPEECKIIYKLMQNPISGNENPDDVIAKVKHVISSVKKASNIVPQTSSVLSAIGVKAGTGVAISGLSGTAATNATLAFLGGGSVSAGGLGMLGGLAVATGGAALIGAAALACIVSISQTNKEDKLGVGVAATAGIATSAAVVGAAWTAVSTFGIAGTAG